MSFLTQVLTRTPIYVWLLLAYVVWQGIQALRPRTTFLARALVLPLMFIVSGVAPLVIGSETRSGLLLAWAAGASLFAPIGLFTGPAILAVDRRNRSITRAGSVLPLIRNLSVFLTQYAIAVSVAIHGDAGRWLTVAGRGISGATAGYFLGWAIVVCRRYFGTPVRPL